MARRDVDVFALLDAKLAKVSDSDTIGREQIEYIDLDMLDPDPRNFYNLPGIPELAENIRLVGLQQPLRVRPKENGHFEIVTGHRRHRALLRLAKEEGLEQFAQVPCIRERTGESSAMERIRLICGNCDNRTMSSAELALQAEALEAALLALKKEGFEFSGRTRERVAQLLQVSETKIANAKVIKNGLKVPGIREKWAQNEIPEAAALEIARLPAEAQYRLLDWVINGYHSYSMRDVKKFAVIWGGCMHKCPESSGFCTNAEAIYNQDYHGGEWSGAGCCMKCLARYTCQAACGFARPHEPEECVGGIAPPPKLENRVEDTRETWSQKREQFSARLRELREKTGMDRQAFADSIGQYKATYSAWENGNLPGSDAFPRLAKALGVSTDYLYGLTDDPAPKPAPAQWQPLDEVHWPADEQLVILAFNNGLGEMCYATARCVGGYHDIYPFEDTDVGCELNEPSHGDYEAGYGGLAFYINKMLEGNVKVYQGIYYPKVKASVQGEEYSTKGESITLANSKIRFLASACNSGDWKILSKDFETETEAASWVDEKIKASV